MFKRFWWVFLAMLPAGAMVGFLLAAVVTYVMPKTYDSIATIEVKPPPPLAEGVSPRPTGCGVEFDVFKSHSLLGKVIANLELTNKWRVDQETAMRILKVIVLSENLRGTDLISIRVRHTNREEARDIAAEVARVYRDYRKEILNRDQEWNLAELNKAGKDQEEKVEECKKLYAKLLRNMGPHPSLLIHDEASDTPEEAMIRKQNHQDRIDAKRNLETDQALLQRLKLKQIGTTMETKFLDGCVVILEEPQIADAPVSPNVTLNWVLGGVLGFVISPLLALPLMLRLRRLNPASEGGYSVHPG